MKYSRRTFLGLVAGFAAAALAPFGAFPRYYVMQSGERLAGKTFHRPTTVVMGENCVIQDCTWLAGGYERAAVRVTHPDHLIHDCVIRNCNTSRASAAILIDLPQRKFENLQFGNPTISTLSVG